MQKIQPEAELIYILGRGHSGSTLISAALGNASNIHSAGELNYKIDSICGCGEPVTNCPFWLNVSVLFAENTSSTWAQCMGLIRRQAINFRSLLPLLFNRPSHEFDQLTHANIDIITAISSVSAQQYILDASKQPLRALLTRHMPSAKFIHLVRRPEGYLSSYYHRAMHNDEVFFLGRYYRRGPFVSLLLILMALSWLIGNLLSELVGMIDSKRVLRVRYEDLTADPRRELNRIGHFLSMDLSSVILAVESGELLPTGHIIGGNARVRTEQGFRFQPNAGNSREIPWAYKIIARLFSWPLMFVYGYPVFRRSDLPKHLLAPHKKAV